MKIKIILSGLVILALCPITRAVSPPTDSPTSFSNTAYGDHALEHNNGFFDSAFRASALEFNTNGNYNSAIGAFALRNNTTQSLQHSQRLRRALREQPRQQQVRYEKYNFPI